MKIFKSRNAFSTVIFPTHRTPGPGLKRSILSNKPSVLVALAVLLVGFARMGLADATADFQKANQLYDKGDFSGAKQGYESLERTGNRSAALFYNLGNTEFRLNHPGDAILNYERALALEPSHPEARANLAFVREKTSAKTAARSWLDYLFPPFSLNQYTLVAMIAGWMVIFSIAGLLFKGKSAALWLAFVPALISFAYASGAVWYYDKDRTLAVVTAEHTKAQFAPADNSPLSDTLPVGSRVRILRDRGAWIYCQLPNGNAAWIPAKSITPVRPTETAL